MAFKLERTVGELPPNIERFMANGYTLTLSFKENSLSDQSEHNYYEAWLDGNGRRFYCSGGSLIEAQTHLEELLIEREP